MRRHRDDTGASSAEYALLLAAIAAVLVVVLWQLGGVVTGLFSSTCDGVKSKVSPGTSGTC